MKRLNKQKLRYSRFDFLYQALSLAGKTAASSAPTDLLLLETMTGDCSCSPLRSVRIRSGGGQRLVLPSCFYRIRRILCTSDRNLLDMLW